MRSAAACASSLIYALIYGLNLGGRYLNITSASKRAPQDRLPVAPQANSSGLSRLDLLR